MDTPAKGEFEEERPIEESSGMKEELPVLEQQEVSVEVFELQAKNKSSWNDVSISEPYDDQEAAEKLPKELQQKLRTSHKSPLSVPSDLRTTVLVRY